MESPVYEEIKEKCLKDINLILKFDQTKVFEEGIKFINFSQVCQLTQWFSPTMNFLKSVASDFHVIDETLFKKLTFTSPEQLYMIVFLHAYFEPMKKSQTQGLRNALFAGLTKNSNILHQITLLQSQHHFARNIAIYSQKTLFIRHFFPDFYWDPIYTEIVDPKRVETYFTTGGLDIKQFSQDLREKFFNIMDKRKTYTFSDFFFPLIDATNDFLTELKSSQSEIKYFMEGFLKYVKKIAPDKSNELGKVLVLFQLLLRLSEYQSFAKINYAQLKKELAALLSPPDAEKLMQDFFYEKKGFPFNKENPLIFQDLFEEYHRFLSNAGICHFGQIYTGYFYIWHSFFGVVDKFQSDPRFRERKGQLLENFVLVKLQKKGIEAQKLILKNTNIETSDRFYLMKDQIQKFPQDAIIEIDVAFPPEYQSCFYEIDLIYKNEQTLTLVEVKGTHVHLDELNLASWAESRERMNKILIKKRNLIRSLLPILKGQNPFFEDIEDVTTILLKTEGLIFEGERHVLTFLDELKG
ncbi:hypothetical protein [Candidatus Lokiarchaeum ossiferum]|uniref:hypothetical protein n=1 Tax=Candidatus Lokiarchaeum ossiferum TaxID=2951803 RepID=UPI00352C489C